MKTLDMPVDSQHGGTFWLASDDPEQAVHGVLRRTASNLTLEVYESLTSLLREVRRSQLPDGSVAAVDYAFADDGPEEQDLVIHGRLDNGVAVTLVDCFTSARRGETQTLSPLYMLYGLHASGGDAVFTKARVRLRHLDEWLSLPGFRLDVQPDSTSTLSYSRPVTEQVALGSGGRLSVHLEQKAAAVTATGGSITRNAAFQVEPREPLSWREIGRSVVVPLQTLLSLCTLRECPPGLVQVEQTGTGWATVISRMSAGASPITTTTHHFLVSFSDIRLHGVARWLDSVERLGPLPPVVARAIADRSSVMLETQLLELTTVAEGLHRRLFPNATRMSDAIANRVRQATSDALCAEAEETQSVVTGMFRHLTEPGYNARMKDLAALAEPLLPFVTGKTNRWSRRVEESRNTFAHRSHGFLEHDVDEELTIAESLSWVLAGVLLAQAGCTHTTVNDDPALVQPYAYFLKRAKRRLPRVFREV